MTIRTWDSTFEASPVDGDQLSNGDNEIRDLKETARANLAVEHHVGSGTDNTGRQREGSARVFVEATAPTTIGASDRAGSNSLDEGRVWDDSGDGFIQYVYSSGWVPRHSLSANGLRNVFRNSAAELWGRQGGKTSWATADLNAGARTLVCQGWAVTSAGAALGGVDRSAITSLASGFSQRRSRYCWKLTGDAGVTDVDFSQRIPASDVIYLKQYGVAFSAYVYNGSGGAFTPQLIFSTADAEDDWSASTDRATSGVTAGYSALQSCADGQWTRVYLSATAATFDAMTNLANGLQVRLRVPSGSLVAGDTVAIAEVMLEPGESIRPYEFRSPNIEQALCEPYFWAMNPESANGAIMGGDYQTTTLFYGVAAYPTRMRDEPTVTYGGAATDYQVFSANTGRAASAVTAIEISRDRCILRFTTAAATAGAGGYMSYVTATGTYVDFDAEL